MPQLPVRHRSLFVTDRGTPVPRCHSHGEVNSLAVMMTAWRVFIEHFGRQRGRFGDRWWAAAPVRPRPASPATTPRSPST